MASQTKWCLRLDSENKLTVLLNRLPMRKPNGEEYSHVTFIERGNSAIQVKVYPHLTLEHGFVCLYKFWYGHSLKFSSTSLVKQTPRSYNMSHCMRFPTLCHFDMCRLGRASSLETPNGVQSVA